MTNQLPVKNSIMKKSIYIAVLFVIILSACKSTASSTSSSSSTTTKNEQTNTTKNTKNETSSEFPSTPGVIDPKGVSTKSPTANPSTPAKKYPSSGGL
jgi:hypothetical protein